MKHKLLTSIVALFSIVTNVNAQNKIGTDNLQIVLQNKITPEIKTFLMSDSVYDETKKSYLKMSSGLNFMPSYQIPSALQNAFLDPIVFGLSIEKNEYIRFISDSTTVSSVLIYDIVDLPLFKSKFENDKLANFETQNGIIELYKNSAFIKESRLVYIFSEERIEERYSYDNTSKKRDNSVEALEASFSLYCTESEYQEYLATAKHLRKNPEYPDDLSPTIEQVKEAKKYGGYNNYYSYYASDSKEEDQMYITDEEVEEILDIQEQSTEINPLSFYRANHYYRAEQVDSTVPYLYEETTIDTVAAMVDSAYVYEKSDYNQELDESSLSEKDQRKLKKARAKEQKILDKLTQEPVDEVEARYEEDAEATEAYEDTDEEKKYQTIHYYKYVSLYENKKYAMPFLNNNYTLNINQKSFQDFKDSKAPTAIWVNQESVSKLFFDEIIDELDLDNQRASAKGEYLKDCALLIELDYATSTKNTATLKGYGNATYINDIKAIFNTQISGNWLANVPKDAALVGGLALNNAQLVSFYKNFLLNSFAGAAKDTLAKEILTLIEIVLDEDAIAKMINGKSLGYVSGSNTYTDYYTSYDYDADYNYTSIETHKQVTVPSFAYFVGFDDKTATQSYLNLIQYFGYLKKENNIYSIYSSSSKRHGFKEESNEHVYMTLIPNALVVSNDSLMLVSILKNKNTTNIELAKTFEQNKIYMKMDFGKMAQTLKETDLGKDNQMTKYFSQFEKIELKGLDFEENKFTLKVNFEQLNKKESQLYSIYKLFGNF